MNAGLMVLLQPAYCSKKSSLCEKGASNYFLLNLTENARKNTAKNKMFNR